MKFLGLLLGLAAPFLAEATCKVQFVAINSWTESGHRYRIQADVSGFPFDLKTAIAHVCGVFYSFTGHMANSQCHTHTDSMAWLDASVAHGPAGDDELRRAFNTIIEQLRYPLQQGGTPDPDYVDCEYNNPVTWLPNTNNANNTNVEG